MNTYILAYANESECWIESVKAKSYNEAQDKFMERAITDWDIDVPTDWDDFKDILQEDNVTISEIKDIDELC